jgi:hypothetical protein
MVAQATRRGDGLEGVRGGGACMAQTYRALARCTRDGIQGERGVVLYMRNSVKNGNCGSGRPAPILCRG